MHRLILIDDHHIVREGFKRLFEDQADFDVVGEASTPDEAIKVCGRLQPDLIMLDLSLGGGRSGLDLLPQLTAQAPDAKTVIVSMHDDPALIVRAMSQGAAGYISKAEGPDLLVSSLRKVLNGESIMSGAAISLNSGMELSSREREIIQGIVEEKAPKVIAFEMGVSDKTLYRHRANLFEKLGARTNGDIIRMAKEHGWLLN